MVRRWSVQVYRDAKVLNDKGVMTRLVTVKRRVLTGRLNTSPDVNRLFTRNRLEWMAISLGSYRENIVQEFYRLLCCDSQRFFGQAGETFQTGSTHTQVLV